MTKLVIVAFLTGLLVGCPAGEIYQIDLRNDHPLVDESKFEGIGVCSTIGERQGALFSLYGMLKPTGKVPRGADVRVIYLDGSSEVVNVLSTMSTVGIVPLSGTQRVRSDKLSCAFEVP